MLLVNQSLKNFYGKENSYVEELNESPYNAGPLTPKEQALFDIAKCFAQRVEEYQDKMIAMGKENSERTKETEVIRAVREEIRKVREEIRKVREDIRKTNHDLSVEYGDQKLKDIDWDEE